MVVPAVARKASWTRTVPAPVVRARLRQKSRVAFMTAWFWVMFWPQWTQMPQDSLGYPPASMTHFGAPSPLYQLSLSKRRPEYRSWWKSGKTRIPASRNAFICAVAFSR
ncbi:hypothetical protein GCM10017744_007810 [Streptomyces antimycoticus]